MATRTLELTRERNQRPAISFSGPVRKTAAHLIGPGVPDASDAKLAGDEAASARRRRRAP
jgi:hypothetical protein